jgi:chromatin remodeling complex protein RSC6
VLGEATAQVNKNENKSELVLENRKKETRKNRKIKRNKTIRKKRNKKTRPSPSLTPPNNAKFS